MPNDSDKEQPFFTVKNPDWPRNIVLIHGAGGDHSHWPVEIADLHGYSSYFLDLPGHGRSPGRGHDSIAGYANAVAGFVEKRALSPVILVGHSMGGAIVQSLALDKPAWLKAIVLVGSGSRLKVAPALLEQLVADFPGAVNMLCQSLFGPKASQSMILAERDRYLNSDWQRLRGDLLACNAFDVTARLSEISLPTLVVSGEADVMTPIKYGRFLKDNIAGAELAVIPAAGHMVALEQPREFTRAVTDFLDTLP